MPAALADIDPGLNSPYGPYGGIPSGNIANSGFAPPSGINTQNQILDLVLNTVFAGVMGDTPMLRTFGRPKVSDYAYTSMQERQRVSRMATPDVISANPMFGSMISGDLGKNRYFQQFADSVLSPGGSMGEAFNTVYGRFTQDLAGPGLRNASTNAVLAANIVKNADKAFLDENGMYDYRKTYGFDRAETYKNADAINRVFGGFTGFVDTRDEADRAIELGTLSQTVLEEAERRGDIKPEQAEAARQRISEAESVLQTSRNIAPTEMTNFVGRAIQDVGTQLGIVSAEASTQPGIPQAPEVPAQPDTPQAPEVPAQPETPQAPEVPAQPDTPQAPEVPAIRMPVTPASEIEPEEISEEVKQKRARFNELNQQYQEVKKFLDVNKETPEVGVNKIQSEEIERRLDQIVEEITVLDEQKGQERKAEFNAIKRQIKGDVETAVTSAQDAYQEVINNYGTPQQQGLALETQQDRTRGPMAVLAEAPTPENAERQEEARNKLLENNKMVREAQNLFGQDLNLDEIAQSIKGMVEGSSGMTTSKVTDLLQRIQATAVVVDMSNEAIVKYFDVIDNMYKGMGVRAGNKANMAQNAILAADAVVKTRKEAAEARGEMYTGPDTGELAQKYAEYQGKFVRSPRNSRVFAYLTTLSDDGPEGEVKRKIQERVAQGDMQGAMDAISSGRESGQISADKERLTGALESTLNESGTSPEQMEYVKKRFVAEYGEEKANQIMAKLTGEDFGMVAEATGKNFGDKIFGAVRDNSVADMINERLGAGASDKIREALSSGEISGDEMRDPEKLRAKLGTMFTGASSSTLGDARDIMVGQMYAKRAQEDLDVMLSPEQIREKNEKAKRMADIKGEIDDTINNRASFMRDLNPGGETFTVVYDTLKKMKDAGVTDFSNPQAIIAAAGGAIGDWAGLTEAQKKQMNAAVQTFTSRDDSPTADIQTLEGMEGYKDKVEQIERDAENYGLEQEAIAIKEGVSDPKLLESIREGHTKTYKEREMEKLQKEFSEEQAGTSGEGEKSAFDSDGALQNLLTAISEVATAIANLGTDKTARSDGNPDAHVEQNSDKFRYVS